MNMKLTTSKWNKKNWFTLIEILIIIVIMSSVLLMTIYRWAENIFKLKYRTAKEEFLSNFQTFYANSLESNYKKQNRFDKLEITFLSWENWFFYLYTWDYTQTWKKQINLIKISEIKIDSWVEQNQAKIEILPYKLWCQIKDINNITWYKLDLKITVNDIKTYCMYLLSTNCKIKETNCTN